MLQTSTPVIEFRVEVVVEPDEAGFHAYCPALKGLHVGGATVEEALGNAKDAAIAYLRSLIKHGDPIPVGIVVRKEEKRRPGSGKASSHTQDLAVACV